MTCCSHIYHKNEGHTSPPIFCESSPETLRPTCYRIPMCSRNVNNAAKLCSPKFIQTAPFMHQNPLLHFPSSEQTDHIAVSFQQLPYLCSSPVHEPTWVCWHPCNISFFLPRRDSVWWNVPTNSSNSTESLRQLGHMEESCQYNLNQERDSITDICSRASQNVGNPPTGRKTNTKGQSNIY